MVQILIGIWMGINTMPIHNTGILFEENYEKTRFSSNFVKEKIH